MQQNRKMLIGAVVAAALAIATYYGLISQQTATSIQNQANQQLGTAPAGQQPGQQAPTTQAPTTQMPTSEAQAPSQPVTPSPPPQRQ